MIENGLHDIPRGKVAMIVTHLEMLAPATQRAVPQPEGVSLRRVTPDLEWYRDIFTRVGAMEWLWFGRLRLPDAALTAIITDPDVHIYTFTRDGRDEALLELDFRQSGECELAYFGLTPALIGSGAGRYLMNEAISRAWAGDITRFHVHTCTLDSPQALPFYTRSGFKVVRQQVEVDDDPRLIGVLPDHAGPHVPMIRG